MVDRAGRTVLIDFGIARALDQTFHTRTGIKLGTPEAMAPEQVQGDEIGPPADIYALGVLTYQLLAGRPPFEGDTAHVLHAQVYDPPPSLRALRPDLPEGVYPLVEAALAKQPSQRPRSAGAFVAALSRAAPPPTPAKPQATPAAQSMRVIPSSTPAQVERVTPAAGAVVTPAGTPIGVSATPSAGSAEPRPHTPTGPSRAIGAERSK